jgi:hypothetical protein
MMVSYAYGNTTLMASAVFVSVAFIMLWPPNCGDISAGEHTCICEVDQESMRMSHTRRNSDILKQ